MRKLFGFAVGMAALLAAGSSNASLVYDTISGESLTITGSNAIKATSGFSPLGDSFVASRGEKIDSVTVALGENCVAGGNGLCSDAGSILVYLVPGVSGVPSSSGLTLTPPPTSIKYGTILDTSLTGGTGATTLAKVLPTGGAPELTAGNWWVVLVDGMDTHNGSGNSTATSAKWEQVSVTTALADSLTLGLPTSGNTEALNSGGNLVGNSTSVYNMQIDAPEPASMALLGAGLVGLGLSRRRRAKKQAD